MTNMFTEIMSLISQWVTVGGALWTLWGAIVIAGALKDKSGPQLQQGIWQAVGGGLIMAAAVMFNNIKIT